MKKKAIRKYALVLSAVVVGLVIGRVLYVQRSQQALKRSISCVYIAQTGPKKEALSTPTLFSLLEWSKEELNALSPLHVQAKEAQLAAHPVMKKVELRIEQEKTLLIDYTLRIPVAFLGDFSNSALDAEGHCFPCFPFFTPKRLPTFYLGLSAFPNAPLTGEKISLAFAVLSALRSIGWAFSTDIAIDVSRAFFSSFGRAEVVVTLKKEGCFCHYLRLTPRAYQIELQKYQLLRSSWPEGQVTFDLRLENSALVKTLSKGTER